MLNIGMKYIICYVVKAIANVYQIELYLVLNEKNHSDTRGTFILHGSEAESLKNHPYISWVELDPTEYPDEYPQPSLYGQRFESQVKVYRDLVNGQVTTSISNFCRIK